MRARFLLAAFALFPSVAMAQVHSQHAGHSAAPPGPEIPIKDAPQEAYSGPLFAADAALGAEEMTKARAAMAKEMGGMPVTFFMADRAEYRAGKGADAYLWDVQGYYGGDLNKLWIKSEGEGEIGGELESAQVDALWSKAIAPYFDMQTGVRQDLVGEHKRTYAVLGIEGLAPYLFEVGGAVLVSHKGEISADMEAELDQRITQRLILQPRAEAVLSAQNVPELGLGAGLSKLEAGVRLRYEFAREFAPYIGVEQEWKLGQTAEYARAEGHETSATRFVAGVRFWF